MKLVHFISPSVKSDLNSSVNTADNLHILVTSLQLNFLQINNG